MTLSVAGAAKATIGARSYQEDYFQIWPESSSASAEGSSGLLTVVTDGMGGHRGGDVAAQSACTNFVSSFISTDKMAADRLSDALTIANASINARIEQDDALRGMGCTLVGAWFGNDGLRWVSVGDSLLLLYRFPELRRLNADHSLGAYLDEQARLNAISEREALESKNRHALRSALTGKTIDMIDLQRAPVTLKPDDWIILATDGLATLEGDEIGDLVFKFRSATPAEMAAQLIQAIEAKKVPDQDNTTVVAVKISGTESVPAEEAKPRPVAEPEKDDHPRTQPMPTERLDPSALPQAPTNGKVGQTLEKIDKISWPVIAVLVLLGGGLLWLSM